MKKITLLFALLISSIGFSQAPTSAAQTPPTRDSGDVISLFTKSTDASTTVYSDISGINFNPNWGSTSGNVVEETLNGDVVMKYPAFHYQGIVINQNINLSAMTMMHVDIWTNSISPNVYLISASTGEKSVNVTANSGSWSSVEIPISDFVNQGMSVNDIKELKFDGGNSATDIYIDNIYFYKPPTDPATDATLSDLKVDGVSISGFSGATTSYTYEVQIGTTTAPSITDATTNNAGASRVINQASGVPGDATVVVTASNGTDTKTYTVSFTATLPNASSTPPSYGTHLALLADITDTGTFTSYWNPSYYFGDPATVIDLDASAAVNKSAKINLKIGWGGGINDGTDVVTDASANDMVHIDYFIPSSVAPGVNGHQFYLDLISRDGTTNTEAFYGFGTSVAVTGDSGTVDETIVFDSWQSIDIPLSAFTAKGFDASKFFQFKIAAQSDIRTQLGYFDNIYFYKSSTLGTENNKLLGFSMYPNPVNNRLNISAKETIKNADIFNVLGRKVMSVNINKTSDAIDVSNLASGVYLIKYNVNDKVGTAKFIKQ